MKECDLKNILITIFNNFKIMKKFLFIFFVIIYFVFLYVLKEQIIFKDIVLMLQNYIDFNSIFNISIILLFVFIFNYFLDKIFNKINNSKKNVSFHLLFVFKKILKNIIWVLWIITVISNLWYNVSALLAWAWIWWVALALASQKSVANIFWAVNIILNKPFEIWDEIKIWSYNWKVIDIWLIYMKLKHVSWHIIMVPNETITTSVIENLSKKK